MCFIKLIPIIAEVYIPFLISTYIRAVSVIIIALSTTSASMYGNSELLDLFGVIKKYLFFDDLPKYNNYKISL
jgi:hypothetical protein